MSEIRFKRVIPSTLSAMVYDPANRLDFSRWILDKTCTHNRMAIEDVELMFGTLQEGNIVYCDENGRVGIFFSEEHARGKGWTQIPVRQMRATLTSAPEHMGNGEYLGTVLIEWPESDSEAINTVHVDFALKILHPVGRSGYLKYPDMDNLTVNLPEGWQCPELDDDGWGVIPMTFTAGEGDPYSYEAMEVAVNFPTGNVDVC